MLKLLTIAGGVALILFGVRHLRKGLDRLCGDHLPIWFQRLSGHQFKAFGSGIGFSVLAPSSTTMSVLAVQMVQAGHMTTRQMLALMMGVDIGLTVTVLLISLQVHQFAMILVLAGVVMFRFNRGARPRGMGQIVLAIGLIFMAIGVIQETATEVSGHQDLAEAVKIAANYPLGMAVVASVITIALQSSTATIGLVIALGAAQIVELPLALAVVAGANIGTGITLLIFGWSQIDSRRLACALLVAKVTVAALVLVVVSLIATGLEGVPGSMATRVALAHTGFNILVALIFLPIVGPLDRLAHSCIPGTREHEPPKFGPRYISTGHSGSVPLALGQSMREVMHMAELVRSMLGELWRALKTGDRQLAEQVGERDDQVDLLDEQIKRFLISAISLGQDPDDAREQMRQLHYLNELESIGDTIDKNLSELVIKQMGLGVDFSQQGWQDLDLFYGKVSDNMLIAETVFATGDRIIAQKLLRHEVEIDRVERELRDRHFERLNAGLQESFETSSIHLDMLSYLQRINGSVCKVAQGVLEKERQQTDSRPEYTEPPDTETV